MPTMLCKHCGQPFEVEPSRLAKGRGRYCSRACHTAALGFLQQYRPGVWKVNAE